MFTKLINIKAISYLKKITKNQAFVESLNTLMLRVFGIISLFGFTLYITNEYPINIVGEYDFIRTYLLVVGCICMIGTDQSILYYAGFLKSKNHLINIKIIYQRMIIMIITCGLLLIFLFIVIGKSNIEALFKDDKIYDVLLKSNFVFILSCVIV